MTRAEFHRIYEQMPEDFRAELIGGIVYVASPMRRDHGLYHALLAMVFSSYVARTPGIETGDNSTILLGDDCELQPDLHLRVLEEHGGASRTTPEGYIEGPPELVAEVSHSSHAIDLFSKHDDYRRYGVAEYLVVSLHEAELRWFDLPADRELHADADDVYRLKGFPGLWIHAPAFFARDYGRLVATLEQGLATPEHAAFVQRLAARRRDG